MDAQLETQITKVLTAFEAASARVWGPLPTADCPPAPSKHKPPAISKPKFRPKLDACEAYLLANPGKTPLEVAQAVGCHEATADKVMRSTGYQRTRRPPRAKSRIIQGIEDNPGMSGMALARMLKVSDSYVQQVMRQLEKAQSQ